MALNLEEAQKILLDLAVVMPEEQLALPACRQRVLARSVKAVEDFPPFDRSPLDGYALLADQVKEATEKSPVVLKVVDNIPAGRAPEHGVAAGTAARIMTGAPLPVGATGVVRLEDTVVSEGHVAVLAGAGAAANICRRGEEIVAGQTVLKAGSVINAGMMGLLALLGCERPFVHGRPRVAVVATGSELVPVNTPLSSAFIRDSNSYMLGAQVAEAGAEPLYFGPVRDNIDEIAAQLEQNDQADLIVSTGGVSVGDYDLLADVYRKLGVAIQFERVLIKPGSPVLAGTKGGKLYIGLSGNPSAACMAFENLVRPVLLKMGGRRDWRRPRVRALLTEPFGKVSELVRFVWGRCFQQGRELVAHPLGWQGNGMLQSAMLANCMIIIPKNRRLNTGSEVEVLLLQEPAEK
jgi:molybdopterin molybdotransferase